METLTTIYQCRCGGALQDLGPRPGGVEQEPAPGRVYYQCAGSCRMHYQQNDGAHRRADGTIWQQGPANWRSWYSAGQWIREWVDCGADSPKAFRETGE